MDADATSLAVRLLQINREMIPTFLSAIPDGKTSLTVTDLAQELVGLTLHIAEVVLKGASNMEGYAEGFFPKLINATDSLLEKSDTFTIKRYYAENLNTYRKLFVQNEADRNIISVVSRLFTKFCLRSQEPHSLILENLRQSSSHFYSRIVATLANEGMVRFGTVTNSLLPGEKVQEFLRLRETEGNIAKGVHDELNKPLWVTVLFFLIVGLLRYFAK